VLCFPSLNPISLEVCAVSFFYSKKSIEAFDERYAELAKKVRLENTGVSCAPEELCCELMERACEALLILGLRKTVDAMIPE
jgi:hypothetical protein